eukprot:488954-Rhodomonas_salina.2
MGISVPAIGEPEDDRADEHPLAGSTLPYPATPCPVLTYSTLLRTPYAMSRTDTAYAATGAATRVGEGQEYQGRRSRPAIPLRAPYAMSGTVLAYGATRDLAFGGISLRACYAVSGTDIAYAAICYRRAAGRKGPLYP